MRPPRATTRCAYSQPIESDQVDQCVVILFTTKFFLLIFQQSNMSRKRIPVYGASAEHDVKTKSDNDVTFSVHNNNNGKSDIFILRSSFAVAQLHFSQGDNVHIPSILQVLRDPCDFINCVVYKQNFKTFDFFLLSYSAPLENFTAPQGPFIYYLRIPGFQTHTPTLYAQIMTSLTTIQRRTHDA